MKSIDQIQVEIIKTIEAAGYRNVEVKIEATVDLRERLKTVWISANGEMPAISLGQLPPDHECGSF